MEEILSAQRTEIARLHNICKNKNAIIKGLLKLLDDGYVHEGGLDDLKEFDIVTVAMAEVS